MYLEDDSTDRAPALREMLKMIVERREAKAIKARESGAPLEIKVFSAADLSNEPILPLWQERMENAAEDGVMESLYASVREEGWRAYANGGLKAMHALADRACNNDYLASILDHRWDGIGISKRGIWVA